MLKLSVILLFLSCLIASNGQKQDKDWTKLSLSTGAIRGRKVVTTRNSTAFLFHGVPFAEPPVGDLRFRAPANKKKWDGELDTTQYQAACASSRKIDGVLPKSGKMSEDCLHANVFTNENCLSEKNCPVLYYIFGSAWNFNSPFMLSEELVIENFVAKNIVLVTVNYRLGAFGFINTGNKSSAIKNLGILDMIQGLRWTQQEIGNFGGDKKKVTLMGHSDGGQAADMIALSPKTDGLFHQVADMSGPAGTADLREDTNVAATKAFALTTGCATEDLWNAGDTLDTIVTCLRNKSTDELVDAQRKLEDDGTSFFGPAVDGKDGVLPERINELQRKRRPYRLLIGTTSREFRSSKNIVDKDRKIKGSLLYTTCVKLATSQGFKHPVVVGRACADDYAKRPDDVPDLEDDLFIYLPTYNTGEAMRSKGATVYKYSFEDDEIGEAFGNALKGLGMESPYHGQDLVYVMGVTAGKFTPRDEKISQIYSGMFADFIKSGDPSPPYNDKWQPTDDRNNYFKIDFDDNMNMPGNTDGYHASAVQFWTKTAPQLDQNFTRWDINGTFSYEKFAEDFIQGLKEMGVEVSKQVEEEIEKWKNDLQGMNKQNVERLEEVLDDLLHRIQNASDKNDQKHDHRDKNDRDRNDHGHNHRDRNDEDDRDHRGHNHRGRNDDDDRDHRGHNHRDRNDDDKDHDHRRNNAIVDQNMYPSVRNTTVIDINGTSWKTWFWVMTGVCIVLAVILLLTCCINCFSKRRQYVQVTETTGLNPSSVKTYG